MRVKERREHSRLQFSGNVSFEESASLSAEASETQGQGHGTAYDVSESGLCLITEMLLKEKQVLRINLPLPGVSVQTPSLAMVRWVRPDNGNYKIGMMFLI